MKLASIVGVVGILAGVVAFGESTFPSYEMEGYVRTMAVKDDVVIVRIKHSDKAQNGRTETFRLCDLDYNTELAAALLVDPTFTKLKHAMNNGFRVKVGYNSQFNGGTAFESDPGRCIVGIPKVMDPRSAENSEKPTKNGMI